jgi:hypothetical protein
MSWEVRPYPARAQLAQVPVISTTVIFGEKPLARAPSISGCVTVDAAISPTAPQRSQIRNATELDVS